MPGHFGVYDGAYPHFVTSTIVYWIPVFCRDDYCRILVDSLAYSIEHKGLRIHGFVLMPNHFHAVISHTDGRISESIRDIKGFTSRRIADKLRDDGRLIWLRAMERAGGTDAKAKVWQDEFHPEQVHSAQFLEQKLRYMHENPVRAGYVDDSCDWKYSSAGFYYREQQSPVPVEAIDW